MRIVNLTPHNITLRAEDGTDTTIAPSGTVARVATIPGEPTGRIVGGVLVFGPDQVGEVTGLPEPIEGTVFIVSGFVAAALAGSGRGDVFAPGTGPADGAVRNERGHVVAVTRLKASA